MSADQRSIIYAKLNNILSKDTSQAVKSDKDKPFIQDNSVVFSLEFKF